jgi:hypothetical protein
MRATSTIKPKLTSFLPICQIRSVHFYLMGHDHSVELHPSEQRRKLMVVRLSGAILWESGCTVNENPHGCRIIY